MDAPSVMSVRHTRSPVLIARRVIYALLMREVLTRFGAYRFGVVWLLLDPLIQVLIMVGLFAGVFHRMMPNVDYAVFIAVSIVPWMMFSNIITRGMVAVESNKGLFAFRQVRPIDALVARVVLEVLVHAAALVVVIFILHLLGYVVSLGRPIEFLLACFLMAFMASALALILICVQRVAPEVKKGVEVVMRLLYFVSGIIIPMSAIPASYRHYFDWNPLLHAMEFVHEAFFPAFHSVGGSWSYLAFSALVLNLIACVVYFLSSRKLLA